MATQRRSPLDIYVSLTKCRIHFESEAISFDRFHLANGGNLRLSFEGTNEFAMREVDNEAGHVFINYLETEHYEVDYDAAEQDPIVGGKAYKTAVTCWCLAFRFNIPAFEELARNHTLRLAKLIDPLYVVQVSVDSEQAIEVIPGFEYIIENYSEEILLQTPRARVEEVISQADIPQTPGEAYVMAQLMLKAQGETLIQAWRLIIRAPINIIPFHILRQVPPPRRQEEETVYEPQRLRFLNEAFYIIIPKLTYHRVETPKLKRGKVMRAMAATSYDKQHVGTRNKEKLARMKKAFFNSFLFFIRPSSIWS
ncbi:hypothetical protein IL306_005459 [Fusarium sp. DS 682]|nr:hypothetical protein IL306_005459 [Fusarium sp. DS 682]